MKKNNKKKSSIKKRLLFVNAFLVLFLFLGLGYSALSTDLNITGDIQLKEYLEPTLYNVLKSAAEEGTYAKEYTGNHNDSMDSSLSTEKIYHWDADNNDTKANQINARRNVIFGGFCWQMYRTTDTGGVKMIYNGVPSSGQCNATALNRSTSYSDFNSNRFSLSSVGYMYNESYPYISIVKEKYTLYSYNPATSTYKYYISSDVSYDSNTNKYVLNNPTNPTWSSIYSTAEGMYTCLSTTETSCTTVYYIISTYSYGFYCFELTEGHLLNYYNTTLYVGDSYTENNGNFTIVNPTIIQKKDWKNDYSNVINKYLCENTSTCSDMRYILLTQMTIYQAMTTANNYIFASDFTYNETTSTYTLNSDRVQFWDGSQNANQASINTHHYTCKNDTGTCSTIYYIYLIDNIDFYSIELTSGEAIGDALNKMLYSDDVNTTNSIMKNNIENWYRNNLTAYTDKLEDTIFCNDRRISNLAGWNPNGGSVTTQLSFNSSNSTDLSCTRTNDKFSVSNIKAQLQYPVGLMTAPEARLLNSNRVRETSGYAYWLLTPNSTFDDGTKESIVSNGGNLSSMFVDTYDHQTTTHRVRPVISLKPGTEYSSGTGSSADPYIVE